MNELKRFVKETLEKLEAEIGDYSKKVSELQKELNNVKLQNEKLIKENNGLITMLDEKDHRINTLTTQNENTKRKNEELQQQIDTVLDKLKRKGLLILLTGESQVDNKESLIKLITTQKEKTNSEIEDLQKELQITKEKFRRQQRQNLFTLTKQEYKFDINDIPSTSTSIKTEFKLENFRNQG